MVECKVTVLISSLFAIVCLFHEVSGLQCYECRSTLDAKCGESLTYKSKELEALKTNCTGITVACRKLVTRDAPKGLVMVQRSCWESVSVESPGEDFFDEDCNKVMGTSLGCYCQDELCNGKQPFVASSLLVVMVVALCKILP